MLVFIGFPLMVSSMLIFYHTVYALTIHISLLIDTSNHTLPFGGLWNEPFWCENATYNALPAGYKGLYRIGHIIAILISKSLQSINRVKRALSENCDDSLHLLDPVAAHNVFLLPIPEIVTGMQKRSQKWLV